MRNRFAAAFVAIAAVTACQASVPVRSPYQAVPAPAVAKCSPVSPAPAPVEPDPEIVTVVLHADVEFTKEERAALERAAATWRQQTGGLADIQLVYDLDFANMASLRANVDHHVVIRFDSEASVIQKMDCQHAGFVGLPCGLSTGPKVLGFVSPAGGINADSPMRIGFVHDRVVGDGRLEGVALHELGHVFGIAHLQDNVESVMYPAYRNDKRCLRKADLEAFCEAQTCGNVDLSPCEG